ncbi:MAG: ATP-dependent RecD-like DNA helicase [Streptococcaceae bacterium]|jgi:exodeoxyribonuclease V alpha subunit|nr:ATP-dependent RecD-like DNA helicase [Streptococcaceae bacterium]
MNEKIYFSGKVAAIFFSNPSNLYKVLLLEIEDTNDESYEDSEIVVTGTIGDIVEGDDYVFRGHLTSHPKYGQQLAVETYEKSAPATVDGLIKFLSSSKFPGIGKETAKKIIKLYPKNTVDTILDSPDKLNKIMPASKKNAFLQHLSENHGMENVLSRLYSFGLTGRVAAQIFNHYGEKSLNLLNETPYQLVEDIEGIDFVTADRIAADQGIAASIPARYRAALLHVLRQQPFQTGDTYIERDKLLAAAAYLLEASRPTQLDPGELDQQIDALSADQKIIISGTKVFEISLYRAEEAIAANLTRLLNRPKEVLDNKEIDKLISTVENDLDIEYDNLQKSAIFQALENPVFILTGGPGTGKTTIVNGFLEVYARLNKIKLNEPDEQNSNFPILLTAPTGRASRRLSELTGLPASTLHRALGITTDDELDDSANDLSGELLIVDEFSMVDTWLANKLFAGVPSNMKVLIVGDADQLASVGPGQVLTDLLRLSSMPFIKLDKIYRQSVDSTITDLAHDVKNGYLPADFTRKKADRNFFPANSYQVSDLIAQIASAWLKRGNDPFALQVLIPMYKGAAGITAINRILQNIFNPKKDALEFSFLDSVFRDGDKVLQLVNNAESNVFNGDLGKIIGLVPSKYSESKQDELLIDFDGQELTYIRSDWSNIRLAYAMSIHKSQGSEFSSVIVPMVSSYSRMLQRNLLYTAITRAKSSLILIGEVDAFRQAVAKEGTNRATFLLQQLNKFSGDFSEFEESNHQVETSILSTVLIEAEDIDPLIGLTDKDFQVFRKCEHSV